MSQFKSIHSIIGSGSVSQSDSISSVTSTSVRLAAIRLKSTKKSIFRALLSLASAALLIRVFGMLNQIVVTSHFGAGARMDSYFVASALPLLIASLIGSAIEASVIPAYARVHAKQDKAQASLLFSSVLNVLVIGTFVLTVVMLIFRQQLLRLTAPALDPYSLRLATDLAPYIYPAMFLTVIIGYLECILNTEGQFGVPAYAGMLVPFSTTILVLVAGSSLGIVMLCIGMVVGLCLQLVVFIIRVKRAKLSYRPVLDFRNPELGAILATGWPTFLGSLISQASPLIDQIFASFLIVGSISALSYALKLNGVFTGVIFVSLGRAVLPYLSRQAAQNDMKAFKETLRLYLWVIAIGTTFLSIFMIIMAHPVVRILFQHGAFTAEDTNHTASTLIGLMVGLAPMAITFILVRAFNALGKNHILVYLSVFNLIANAVFDFVFSQLWQNQGIALATSLVYFCATFILFFALQSTIGRIDILTPPSEFAQFLSKSRERLSALDMSYLLPRQITRLGVIIAVFTAGMIGIFLNSVYTARIALGSIVILYFIRNGYVLLLTWAFMNAFLGSSFTFLSGNNLLSGLTIPTILVMFTLPFTQALKRMPALLCFLIYLFWVFASIGISAIGVGSFLTYWMSFLDYIAVAILTIFVITTRHRMLRLIDTILLSSTIISLYGIYGYITKQKVLVDSSSSNIRIMSIFGSAPTLSLFLSIVIPLAFYRIFTVRGFKRIPALLVFFLLLLALGLTFTRSATIIVPLSLIFMIFFLPSRKAKIALITGILVIISVLIVLGISGDVSIFARFTNQDLATLNGRTLLWQAILDNFDPTQILGNGLLASNLLLAKLQVSASNQGVIATAPHNLFLGILYDHGIIGVTLLIVVFIALAIGLIKGIQHTRADQRMVFVTSFAILVNVIFQSLDGSDFWIVGVTIYFWIAMALPFTQCWFVRDSLKDANESISDSGTMPTMQAIRQSELARKQRPEKVLQTR